MQFHVSLININLPHLAQGPQSSKATDWVKVWNVSSNIIVDKDNDNMEYGLNYKQYKSDQNKACIMGKT